MKKIAILDHATHLGGGEKVLITLIENLDKSIYDITVLVTENGQFTEELDRKHIKYKVISTNSKMLSIKRGNKLSFINKAKIMLYTLKYVRDISQYVRSEEFKLVYTNSMKAHIYGSLVSWYCNIPLVWRLHDFISKDNFNTFTRKVFIKFANIFPNRILTVSNSVRNSMLENCVKSNKLQTIYNGLPYEQIKTDKSTYLLKYNIENNKKIIGIVGWLIPWKGQDVFIKAAKEVINKYNDVHFLIVGGPLKDSKKFEQELFNYIKRYNIESYFTFTGHVSDVKNILAFMDISVHCSKLPDPLPTVILESMLSNTPVIGVNLGGVPEIINNNVSGSLFDNGDYNMLSDVILNLLSDVSKCRKYVNESEKILKEKFSIEAYVKNHIDVFNEIMG